MIEVFTYIATKIGDALIGDAIKNLRDKPKAVGKALIKSHSRLSDLIESLDRVLVALAATRLGIDDELPTIPIDQLNPFVERDYYFFENDDVLAGMDLRHRGWTRIEGTENFAPTFMRTDDEDSALTYEEFLPKFTEHVIRDAYRSMQRAAICLRQNLNLISEEILSVTDPELLTTLGALAQGDARFAYWVFDKAPAFAFDAPANQIKVSLTTFSPDELKVVRDISPEFEKAASFSDDLAGTTIVSLDTPEDIERASAIIQTLKEQIELARTSIADFVSENWKLNELLK